MAAFLPNLEAYLRVVSIDTPPRVDLPGPDTDGLFKFCLGGLVEAARTPIAIERFNIVFKREDTLSKFSAPSSPNTFPTIPRVKSYALYPKSIKFTSPLNIPLPIA